ncbi:MAG: undecaprenyldiphospho-muramoylpentapeptide beta-N-acetylglucosaminyltransferase [Actinomycetaceae bacterium]|nr:undecaprenyldiphospho-muramoylpentapeptide beta-N-acetylglucosaminyltransferase [Actinomycetaceae bacterium]
MGEAGILLAGGGTAGHVNPLLATAAQLELLSSLPRLVVGTAQGLEAELVPLAGEELLTIERLPLPRKPSLDLLKLPFRLRRSVEYLRRVMRERNIGVVVGFGGYVATPVYLAARGLGLPIVIHEQNARAGLANRLGARWAKVVATTFASTRLRAPKGHTKVVGLPLRPAIAALAQSRESEEGTWARRAHAAKRFGLDADKPVIVVTGGSLGAVHLNEVACPVLLARGQQVIHVTGKGKDEGVSKAVRALGAEARYKVFDYLLDMEEALALADVVVCRAGAGTVAEMSALGIPAIYVPLPIGNGEQKLNASGVVDAGGAILIEDADLDDATLSSAFDQALEPERNASMAALAKSCGTTQAATKLAQLVLDCLPGGQEEENR